jgi:hypothetical protein
LKVGYASSRAHSKNTSRSGFHKSHGVFKSFAQAARVDGGLCEFARARQQDQSLGFGFSSSIETWLKALHLALVFS